MACRVTSVYDGDTFRCDLPGLPAIFGQSIPVRIRGIDTPERRGSSPRVKALAEKARRLTHDALKGAVLVELRNPQRGKYFRVLADVYVDDRDLATMLLKANLARPYDGGKREPWEG